MACAQDNQEVTIETQQLSNSVYMLTGQGGNIGLSIGDDGVFMIDDQFANLTPKILEAIKKLSDKPIHYLVNTHWHGDHTGGNENLSKLGVNIIAHDNVYKRLSESTDDKPASPKGALPVITFNDKLHIHVNGEDVFIFHVDNAHTDGDVLLYFTESNVLHTGDTFFNHLYPYIDLNSGGTVDGYIEAVKRALMVTDNETKIIPGHGKLSNKKEYQFFLSMLETLKASVLTEIAAGKTEDQVAENTAITKTFDELGYSWTFINSEKIRRTFYKSLKL
jgi:glyoxylase-like metal-dependent hydrolase (beta-lactamase superfamily II)